MYIYNSNYIKHINKLNMHTKIHLNEMVTVIYVNITGTNDWK